VYALGKVSPRGWRLPTEADWAELINVGCGGDVKKLIEGEFKAVPVGFRAESTDIPSHWPPMSLWFCGLDTKEGRVSVVGMVGGEKVGENNKIDYYRKQGAGLSVRLIKESSV
jgi:hypothetical protein